MLRNKRLTFQIKTNRLFFLRALGGRSEPLKEEILSFNLRGCCIILALWDLVDFSTTLPEQVLVVVDIGIRDVRWCSLLISDLGKVD